MSTSGNTRPTCTQTQNIWIDSSDVGMLLGFQNELGSRRIYLSYIYISIKIDVLRAPTFGEAVENRIWNQRTGVVLVQELKSLWRPPTVVKLSGTEILMMRMRNAVKEELETIGSWVHCFHTWVWSAFRMIADKEHEDEDNDNKCLPA